MKALALWADNQAANLGLRVLAQGAAEFARLALGRDGVEVDFQDFKPGDSAVSFGTRAILGDIGRRDGPITAKLRRYELVLDTGAGDSFADIYGLKRLAFIAYAHRAIRRLGVPLVLTPQTIGPFRTRIGRHLARRSLRQAALVFARDQASADYAATVLGRPVDGVGTDLVFLLPRAATAPREQRDVLLNVSGLLWFGDEHVDSAAYRRAVVELVARLTGQGRKVALLAHVVHSPSGNDDVDAARELAAEWGGEPLELLVPEGLDEARGYLASARLVVGARMHACLNALSQGVPAIPWAYSRKFAPLLDGLGWPWAVELRTSPDPVAETLAAIENAGALHARAEEIARDAPRRLDRLVATMRETLAPREDGAVSR